MKPISLEVFAKIVSGEIVQKKGGVCISGVTTDSRRIGYCSVFFPLQGENTNGHKFIGQAFNNGAIASVVKNSLLHQLPSVNNPLIKVADPLIALQKLAAWKRTQISGELIGITGSNGKTIVKDALLSTLSKKYFVGASPGSYNSQLGVPLSILRIHDDVDYAILEAGISKPMEMDALESMIRPNYGILTNIGLAHISSFKNKVNIAKEKIKLFKNISQKGWVLIPCVENYDNVLNELNLKCKVYRFGKPNDEIPFIENAKYSNNSIKISIKFPEGSSHELIVYTPSFEIISDIEIAICAAYLLGIPDTLIADSLNGHKPPQTRMEIWESPTGIKLINDSCSSDPISVESALKSLNRIKKERGKGIFVFGGMKELRGMECLQHFEIGKLAAQNSVDLLVLVGDNKELKETQKGFISLEPKENVLCYDNIHEAAKNLRILIKEGDTILFKGPRYSKINNIAQEIIGAIAPNRLIVDLQAISENIARFRSLIGPNRRILGMVKALSYGSDLIRLSKEVQNMGLDYLGVSTPDEGVQLRMAGIDLPIIVFVCTQQESEKILRYGLIPVIYSFDLIEPISRIARKWRKKIDVHLKVDTGMGRLGVLPKQLKDLAQAVLRTNCLNIVGLMTHFSCAENPQQDDFTKKQIECFRNAISELNEIGINGLLCHAAATSSTVRFPESHFDMVRIGLGMYGIYPSIAVKKNIELDLAVTLLSKIEEIRTFSKGYKIGYGATYTVPYDNFKIGFLPIGYYDGVPWSLSNNGYTLVNGKRASIVGKISMDSMMIDLNDFPDIKVGANVLLYGKHDGDTLRPEDIADKSDTIAYELLIRLGPRIQKIFYR